MTPYSGTKPLEDKLIDIRRSLKIAMDALAKPGDRSVAEQLLLQIDVELSGVLENFEVLSLRQ